MNKRTARKIMMIATTPFFADRGCHIRILNSYLSLKKEKIEIDLFTYPLGREIEGIKTIRPMNIPGYHNTGPYFNIYRPIADFLVMSQTFWYMLFTKYDYIYAHLFEGALAAVILKLFFGKKVVFDCQGSLVGELEAQGKLKQNSILYNILFSLERFIVNNVDHIYTSTEDLKKFIETITSKIPVEVVKDLPDHSLFNQKVQPAKLDLPKDKKIVVYLGGLSPNKGIKYLLEAIPLTSTNIHFLIMGYPVEWAYQYAEKLRILDRITFTGTIAYEKAPSFLKLGQVAVSPKTLESKEANAKIYNYLAMDLPVVCFDIPENREILNNIGYFAVEKDIEDLAIKIDQAIKELK